MRDRHTSGLCGGARIRARQQLRFHTAPLGRLPPTNAYLMRSAGNRDGGVEMEELDDRQADKGGGPTPQGRFLAWRLFRPPKRPSGAAPSSLVIAAMHPCTHPRPPGGVIKVLLTYNSRTVHVSAVRLLQLSIVGKRYWSCLQ